MTDDNKKKMIIGLVILICVVLVCAIVAATNGSARKEKSKKISIIVYGNDSDRWENIRRGAMLAGEDHNAEINLITMSSEYDSAEQIALINREIADGVDGIMLAACDSDRIGQYLNRKWTRTPIVMIANKANTWRHYVNISPDDYQMGYELGEAIVSHENPIVKVAVIMDATQRENIVNRAKGVHDVIDDYANEVVIWSRNENEDNISAKQFLQRALVEEAVDVIVALDNETADALMDAIENLNMTRKVYAISTSDQSVYYLDQKKIKVLEYQTEFGMGFAGAQYILDKGKTLRQYEDETIKYKVVEKDDMYDFENQKLLFPFVK